MNKDNLYTGGNEFARPNGKPYVGSYHIHEGRGAMSGASHTSSSVNLTPITAAASKKVSQVEAERQKSFIRTSRQNPRPGSRSTLY